MSTRTCVLGDSGHPPIVDQAVICDRCVTELERALGDVAATLHELTAAPVTSDGKLVVDALVGHGTSAPWERPRGLRGGLHRDLGATRTRQARVGGGSGARSTGERPVPWVDQASRAQIELGAALARWVRVVESGRGVSPARKDSESVAGWLLGQVAWLRRHPSAGEAVTEVVDAVRAAARVIDSRPQRWYAGPCRAPLDGADDCPCDCHDTGDACTVQGGCDGNHQGETCDRHLYAVPGRATVECPACGAEHDVEARRAWLLAAAEDQLAHAALVATAVTTLGRPVTVDRIYKWKSRGRIVEHSVDHQGRPLYRVGDILDLLAGATPGTGAARSTEAATR
ncbi:hypothetical protein [Thalassiella azotivora]